MIIAQGKAAEAAALGKRPPPDTQPPLFPGLPRWPDPARQTRKKGRGLFCARNPGRRSFLACLGLLSWRPYRTSTGLTERTSWHHTALSGVQFRR